ncbi:MAG TPA: hypothetical protein PK513_03240 [Alphaproteobacteria bacterium]|nr:hypothetical protein [Alphaproteobacteria bacterium]USO05490.1 MAG: hypothetical protein H6859_10190 [Rhodospirillales bacterium]HOO81500.1 hypothetical protein [Alphaproteobacteria bacterium]
MSYYDWTLEQNAEQYDGLTLHWYFPRTGNTPMTPGDKKLNEDRQEAQRFLELGVVNNQGRFDTQRVQSHLTKVFGKNAVLVGIKSSKPDMFNGWRCDDIRFDWVDKTEQPDPTETVS